MKVIVKWLLSAAALLAVAYIYSGVQKRGGAKQPFDEEFHCGTAYHQAPEVIAAAVFWPERAL